MANSDVSEGTSTLPTESVKSYRRRRCTPARFCQIFTAFILGLFMTSSLVINRLSLTWLLTMKSDDKDELLAWYAAMMLVLIVPEAVTLIKVFWHTSFIKRTKTNKWPACLAIFVGTLTSFAEASSYAVFSLEVAPLLPGQLLLPLLSAVLSVTLVYEQWKRHKEELDINKRQNLDANFILEPKQPADLSENKGRCAATRTMRYKFKLLFTTVFGLSGIWSSFAIGAILALTSSLSWFHSVCLPVSLFLLSLCWHPLVQVYIIRSADGTFLGRWKATGLYSIIKSVVIFMALNLVMLLSIRQHGILDRRFFNGLWSGLVSCQHPALLYPMLCHFASSLGVHVLGYVGASLGLARSTILAPFVMATPLSVGIFLLLCTFLDATPFSNSQCFDLSVAMWCACALALISWLAPMIVRGKELAKNCDSLLMPFDEIFVQPSWNSVFIEQQLSLSYKPEGISGKKRRSVGEENPCTRVFMCTTMYREADFEMARLLSSIAQVSRSKKLRNIYMEAHIFMDNGTQDSHITDFGSQLVSLLESKIGVSSKDANAYTTPYGVQLNWLLPGGMPFFIHLKDPNKVKAKKRWSQIMYMSYVLNFRVLNYDKQNNSKLTGHSSDSGSTIADSLCLGYASEREWQKNFTSLANEDKMNDLSPNLTKLTSAIDSKTKRYLRESKRKLVQMARDGPYVINFHKLGSTETMVSTVQTSSSDVAGLQTSSDTGIGTSDDVISVASSSAEKNGVGSDESGSRQSSSSAQEGGDELWRDYEGDISSNNESSMSSTHARFADKAREFARQNGENFYENVPYLIEEEENCYYNVPYRPSLYWHYQGDNLVKKHQRNNAAFAGKPIRNNRPKRELGQARAQRKPVTKSKKDIIANGSKKINELSELNVMKAIYEQSGNTNLDSTAQGTFTCSDASGRVNPLLTKGIRNDDGMLMNKTVKVCKEERCLNIIRDSPESAVIQLQDESTGDILLQGDLHSSLIDDHTYILATDADMEFTDNSVLDLLNLCHYDRRVGGACGRTHPIGQTTGPLVWYQKFEYAKDFWMIKSAQNVIGSVMCCPGCFSLYRARAVRDVLTYYASPTSSSFDVFIKDTGEDRWMCTLMMLEGWKLEYTAFCDNTTFCPDTFNEFMRQRRRWVLSDLANMLLVFRNVFRLTQNNDSFSVAYILYLAQMFSIVLLSPASTVVIIAGGLDIVYGVPYALVAPLLGVLILTYALVCILGSMRLQERVSLVLTMFLGLTMLLVVVGGSVFVVQDITTDIRESTLMFQEYYLILLLIAALVFAAFVHPKETWILSHGLSYLLGFPAMQILLPIYSMCNIVDQSWGTREKNESKSPPVSCFAKNRKKYHKSLSKKSGLDAAESKNETECEISKESRDGDTIVCPREHFQSMSDETHKKELSFWSNLRQGILDNNTNVGLQDEKLNSGLRRLRNLCLLGLLLINCLWLVLLSVLYYNADLNLAKLNVYGLIAGAVYGLVLLIQLMGMSIHRVQALFTRFGRAVFGGIKPVWIHHRVPDT